MRISNVICFAFTLNFVQAHADPPPTGHLVTINQPMLACDTETEINQALEGIKTGKFKEVMNFLGANNGGNEPACIYSTQDHVTIDNSTQLERVYFVELKHDFDVWICHCTNLSTSFYLLWLEPINETDT